MLDRLARKDVRWWAGAGRREAARALAAVWASRTKAPVGAVPTWPRDHGIVDLLLVLAADVERVGGSLPCPELDALLALA